MKIYHIEFAKIGHTLTGGEVCMLELIKHFESRGLQNVLYTTDNGLETYRAQVPPSELLEYRTIASYEGEKKFGPLASYFLRTFQAVKLVRGLRLMPEDIVICHSDFFPNSIPAFVINRHNPQAKSVNFFHMKAPGLLRGYQGEFAGTHQLPNVALVHYRLNQWLYHVLTLPKTIISTVNPYYLEHLRHVYPRSRIKVLEHFGGAEPARATSEKCYDVIWIGRFHPQKGIGDLAKVIRALADAKPDVHVAIVGGGSDEALRDFSAELQALGVQRNVELLGFVGGAKKFELLAQSRVFAMTSYYESFGIVVLEALASGVPVVAYDLPVYGVFKNGILRVPIGDYQAMAQELLQLLDDQPNYKQLQQNALSVAAEHSWAKTGDELLEVLHV